MRFRLIIWTAVCIHLTWALCLLVDTSVTGITAVASMHAYAPVASAVYVVIFSAVAIMAAAGLYFDRFLWHRLWLGLLLCMPQQAVLVSSAMGAVLSVIRGAYGDGEPRPRAFIAADQSVHVFLCVFHTAALWYTYTAIRFPVLQHGHKREGAK